MLNRIAMRLVLRFSAARAVRLGMIDGQCGALPMDIHSDYYMGGYRVGRAKLIDRSLGKP